MSIYLFLLLFHLYFFFLMLWMANDRSTVRERRGFCVTWRETEGSLTFYMCRAIVQSSAVGGLFISLIFLLSFCIYICHRQPTTILLVSLCVSGERFGLLLKVQQKMNIFNFIILYVENRNIRVKRTPSIWIVWKTYEISSSSPTPRSHLIQFYTTENPFDQLWWRLVVTAHVDSHSQLVVTQRPCISTNDPP